MSLTRDVMSKLSCHWGCSSIYFQNSAPMGGETGLLPKIHVLFCRNKELAFSKSMEGNHEAMERMLCTSRWRRSGTSRTSGTSTASVIWAKTVQSSASCPLPHWYRISDRSVSNNARLLVSLICIWKTGISVC